MNSLVNTTQIKTMSSRDLLEMINAARAEHGEPIIRLNKFNEKIIDELGDDDYTFSVVQNLNGTESTIYHLSPDQCILLAMRESKSVRRIVLEKIKTLSKQFVIPTNLSEALRLAADNIEARERAESQLAIAAPKAVALDLLTDAEGLFGIREAAKTLKITQSELTTLLVRRNWMFRDGKNVLQGYATRIEQGYIEHVMSAPVQDKIGVDHVYSSAKITAKGMARLAQILAKEQAA